MADRYTVKDAEEYVQSLADALGLPYEPRGEHWADDDPRKDGALFLDWHSGYGGGRVMQYRRAAVGAVVAARPHGLYHDMEPREGARELCGRIGFALRTLGLVRDAARQGRPVGFDNTYAHPSAPDARALADLAARERAVAIGHPTEVAGNATTGYYVRS